MPVANSQRTSKVEWNITMKIPRIIYLMTLQRSKTVRGRQKIFFFFWIRINIIVMDSVRGCQMQAAVQGLCIDFELHSNFLTWHWEKLAIKSRTLEKVLKLLMHHYYYIEFGTIYRHKHCCWLRATRWVLTHISSSTEVNMSKGSAVELRTY